jgi:hypothetical protein
MKKKYILLILNIIIIILEMIAFRLSYLMHGLSFLMFYTEDSNLFALLVAIIYVIYLLKGNIPNWLRKLKYIATGGLLLTFLVVIFILSPSYGPKGYYFMLLSGSMLYQHLLCPILYFISYFIFEPRIKLNNKDVLIAMIPTLIYATIIIILNVLKVIIGPYPFLMVYNQPIYVSILWFLIILGGIYLFYKIIQIISQKIIID